MKIWIDGDSCPKPIKQILFKASQNRKIMLFIVANHFSVIPNSNFIKRILVTQGFDAADNYIVNNLLAKDLVITNDIILANQAIDKQALVLNTRGTLYTKNNIKQALDIRNLNESLRSSGVQTGGPSELTSREVHNFSNHLDKIITQNSPKLGDCSCS